MRTQAIILKKTPIKEHDELIVCYTQGAGQQTFQAKSVRRQTSKQASHLDLLNLVDFSLVHGNGHAIITSAQVLESWPHLKSSLPALAAGYTLAECFHKLVFPNQPDRELWELLVDQLKKYDTAAQDKTFKNWRELIVAGKQTFAQTLGYDADTNLEALAQSRFRSSQFVQKVIKFGNV